MSCPPCSKPEIKSGESPALAAYMAAVYPAGPEPIIVIFSIFFIIYEKVIELT